MIFPKINNCVRYIYVSFNVSLWCTHWNFNCRISFYTEQMQQIGECDERKVTEIMEQFAAEGAG